VTWELFLQLVGLFVTFTGLTLGISKFIFTRLDKLEDRKQKDREKIKRLEGELATTIITQLQRDLTKLRDEFKDMKLKFEDMFFKYEHMSQEMHRLSMQLLTMRQDMESFISETKETFKHHGKVVVLDERGKK